MITIRLYTATGERGERVGLDLRKSDVGNRLLKSLAAGQGNISELTKLDSGELPLSRIASLYSPDEIREAIKRRKEALVHEGAELVALEALLHDHDFLNANGGPVTGGREKAMARDWKRLTVGAAQKSRSHEGGESALIKSSRFGRAADIAVSCGWEQQGKNTRGPQVYVHGQHPGLEILITPESAWTMKKGAKVLAKSQGETMAQRTSALWAHLAEFHRL